jgi:translation initiation factor IF-2
VAALADVLQLKQTEIIKQLFMKGVMVTVNQSLDVPTARSIATALNYIVDIPEETEAIEVTNVLDSKKTSAEDSTHMVHRAPVVSIMGHVDHGKTSLLDAIRQTRHKIVDTEAGGITQSIGAYHVEKDGKAIVFLDTPGHEAFTSMRLRGAKSTDIAILVVAADDGVMPQTIEAISHAKAAGIPIIVAINKIDKADADPDRVLVQLSEHGLVAEKYGGDALTVEVSALQKLGIDDVLETILLVAELLDLKANPDKPADGVIIEAQLDKRKGPVATALVQNGTLRVGDWVLIGAVGGRVRALVNDDGERIELAGPSTPVEILGLSEVPRAGDPFEVTDEKIFKKLLDEAKLAQREETLEARSRLRGVLSRNSMAIGESDGPRAFNIIVKGDTHGSAEAVSQSLQTLKGESIEPTILHVGSGNVSENDVMLARASGAIIIAFNVKEDPNALKVLENDPVQIYKFDVIYHIHDSIKKLMLGQLAPDMEDVKTGEAEVRQLFPVGKSVVAGCMVLDGKITRNAKLRVMRDGKQIFEGPIETLRRFKDDAKEVASGYECGIAVARFNDLQVGDRLEAVVQEARLRTTL